MILLSPMSYELQLVSRIMQTLAIHAQKRLRSNTVAAQLFSACPPKSASRTRRHRHGRGQCSCDGEGEPIHT